MNKSLFTIPLVALTLAGCSTVYEGQFSFDAGWREAVIIQPQTHHDYSAPIAIDCSRQKSTDDKLRVVMVHYRFLSKNWRTGIFHVAPNESFLPGDKVLVNIQSCDHPVIKRHADWHGRYPE